MIELICGYGKKVVLFMIFIFLCEMLMPKYKYRESIGLVCAIFLAMLILKPISETDIQKIVNETDIKTINAEYQYYNEKQWELTEKKFNDEVRKNMENIIGKSIKNVKMKFNDDMSKIEKIDIEIENDGTITTDDEKNIKNIISDFYDEENVNIHIY